MYLTGVSYNALYIRSYIFENGQQLVNYLEDDTFEDIDPGCVR
jgi:hypothetical protein